MESAILVPALLCVLDGSVLEAYHSGSGIHVRAIVRSHSRPDTAIRYWLDLLRNRCGVIPGNGNNKRERHQRSLP